MRYIVVTTRVDRHRKRDCWVEKSLDGNAKRGSGMVPLSLDGRCGIVLKVLWREVVKLKKKV